MRILWFFCAYVPSVVTMNAAFVAKPSIQVLAARQHATGLLQENWATVTERLGGVFSGEMVQIGSSEVHGIGVFAQRDLVAGELITLHPVDRILQTLSDGRVTGSLLDDVDASYFRPEASEELSANELAYRQVAYRQTYRHVNPSRPEKFLVNANPFKPDVTGWLGHRINDGASLSPRSSGGDVAAYYSESGARRNCCAIALCVPLLGFVTTAPVVKGEELLTTMGHDYWMQAAAELSETVEKQAEAVAREVDLWQLATDQKHSSHLRALDDFIMKMSAEAEAQAEGATKDATKEATKAERSLPTKVPSTNGFGGGIARTPPKKGTGKRKKR